MKVQMPLETKEFEAVQRIVAVARLIDRRWAEGSLQADPTDDQPDDPSPIQHQLRDALAALDDVARLAEANA